MEQLLASPRLARHDPSGFAESKGKSLFTNAERDILIKWFVLCSKHPHVMEALTRKDFSKDQLDSLATSFVALADALNTFHASWLKLVQANLAGTHVPTPFSVAVLQVYLVSHTRDWLQKYLAPFFAHLEVAKMKRKRAMKDSDLTFAFQTFVETLVTETAINALPRPVRAFAGLLWASARNLGLDRESQIEVVADFFFQRLLYPCLLVPDQYGLLATGTPLSKLARSILQAVAKSLTACVFGASLLNTPFACLDGAVKALAKKVPALMEQLARDPEGENWHSFLILQRSVNGTSSCFGGGNLDAEMGLWMTMIVDSPAAQAALLDTRIKGVVAEFSQMVPELKSVSLELQRRRAISSVCNEEQEFTLRIDGVTFWLRELDYGMMVEGTALRLANEWLKKVNRERAMLRMSLNKRTHPSQWNGRISDLLQEINFSVFTEFGKVLLSSLPVVANSVDQSLERAILSYKIENQRDPLRDLVAVLVHGRALVTRLNRIPQSQTDEEENALMAAAIKKAESGLDDKIAGECIELVRLHQMQSSIVQGWKEFPSQLATESGIVRLGRKQMLFSRVQIASPASAKHAKLAVLLSDCLVLLQVMSGSETNSSAGEREIVFGGSNAFQQRKPQSFADRRALRRTTGVKPTKEEVRFRLVRAVPLAEGQLRLRPERNMFVLKDRDGTVIEVVVSAAQSLEWMQAWAKIDGMQHSTAPSVSSPRGSALSSGSLSFSSSEAPDLDLGGAPGSSTPGRAASTTPASAASTINANTSSDEDVDDMEALMALGMYDTAVVRHNDEPNDVDEAFKSMVGHVKRRDGKKRIALQDLFCPPPGAVQKAQFDSLRMMKFSDASDQAGAGGSGSAHTSPQQTPPDSGGGIRGTSLSVELRPEDLTEEMQLRHMLAQVTITLRHLREYAPMAEEQAPASEVLALQDDENATKDLLAKLESQGEGV